MRVLINFIVTLFFLSSASAQVPMTGAGKGAPGGVGCTNHTAVDGTATNNGTGTTLAVTLTTANPNDFIVIAFHGNVGGTTISSVSGSTLGAFTARGAALGGAHNIWTYGKTAAGALTNEVITITYSTSQSFATALAWGISGSTSTYDANGGLPATTTSSSDVLISTSNACDFIFAAYYVASNAATAGSTWTAITAVFQFLFVEYKNNLTSTQTNLDATITGDTISAGIGDAVVSN